MSLRVKQSLRLNRSVTISFICYLCFVAIIKSQVEECRDVIAFGLKRREVTNETVPISKIVPLFYLLVLFDSFFKHIETWKFFFCA